MLLLRGGDHGVGDEAPSKGKGLPSLLTSLSLVFIGGDSLVVCGGVVGQSEEKFCAVECGKCPVKSHAKFRYSDIRSGLYIRVPLQDSRKCLVFKEPCVASGQLDFAVVEKLMKEV